MTRVNDKERLRFSVIVASHKRPWWLKRCLTGLRQLDHAAFEIVVVADAESLAGIAGQDFKRVPFDVPNLARARNAGISVAAGDVCAFIDDDAVPEPFWLQHHEEALCVGGAAASVGYVRGRNGISFQSRVASIDTEAETHEELSPDTAPFIFKHRDGRALKLIGTNATVRTDLLVELGGYDPAYAFFLDDADISIRLALLGATTAVAPHAEVHHAFAPSIRRTDLRAPRHLRDIGQSSAVFQRRHRGISDTELFERLLRRERARLARHLVQGTCEPSDFSKLISGLVDGWRIGLRMELPKMVPLEPQKKAGFLRVKPIKGHVVVKSRLLRRKTRLAEAKKIAESGQRASVFSFSLTPVRHFVRYSEAGFWIQTGGQFGRADRNGRLFRWCRFANRVKAEIRRVAKQRGI